MLYNEFSPEKREELKSLRENMQQLQEKLDHYRSGLAIAPNIFDYDNIV